MIPTIQDRLRPLIENAAERLLGQEIMTSWHADPTVLPGVQGGFQVMLFSIFLFKPPLLGHPDFAVLDLTPLEAIVFTQEAIDNSVRNAVEQVRKMKAQILAVPK